MATAADLRRGCVFAQVTSREQGQNRLTAACLWLPSDLLRDDMAHDSGTPAGGSNSDGFVDLLEWLIGVNGDLEGITKVISADTLRNWRDGKYPKHRWSRAVAAVDRWARVTYPGVYPPAWAPGGLIALAGPVKSRTIQRAASSTAYHTSTTDGAGSLGTALPPASRRLGRFAIFTGIAAVVALIVIALFVASRHDAGRSTLYARGGGPVAIRSCPALTCPALLTRPTGTEVTMICYRDAQRANLNYSSPRWFDVRDSSGASGWVHSSEVANQTRVGLC